MTRIEDIDRLRSQIESIADQLCVAVDGRFDFRVDQDTSDETVEKLQLLINFMLDTMQRSVEALELQSQELKAQVEKAEAASKAKASFLANMSHEIRTPLNGILGLTSLLQHSQLSYDQADLVNGVHLSSDNLLSIINDILDFTKIESGKMLFDMRSFDLYEMVLEVVESLAARAAETDVEMIVRYVPGTARRVIADETRLRQVLLNLLGNALKFTETGYILTTISEDTQGFCFLIEDSGIGIDEDKYESLFEEFTQADSSITRRFGGTGLGLAICKSIVEALDGEIGVKANPKGGSIFWFSLPIRVDEKHVAKLLPLRHHVDKPPRVLVVDDNAMNRFVLSEQLASWSMPYICCETGREALQCLNDKAQQGETFDIALLDYSMPEMDGMMLAKTIRAEGDGQMAMVLLSSIINNFSEQELLQSGFQGYLLKPSPPDLIHAMIAVLVVDGCKLSQQSLITRQTLRDDKVNERMAKQQDDVIHILVAEDNIVNQQVARGLLEHLGCVVYIANNGLEALEKLQSHAIDLVLMDMQMPEMNGIEATAAIRHHGEHFHEVPIIALTANATETDRQQCLSAGMNDYLAKPFRTEDLQQILQRWH